MRIISNVMHPAPTRSNATMFTSPAMNRITNIGETMSSTLSRYYDVAPSTIILQPSPTAMNETLHNLSPATSTFFPCSSTPNEMPPSRTMNELRVCLHVSIAKLRVCCTPRKILTISR